MGVALEHVVGVAPVDCPPPAPDWSTDDLVHCRQIVIRWSRGAGLVVAGCSMDDDQPIPPPHAVAGDQLVLLLRPVLLVMVSVQQQLVVLAGEVLMVLDVILKGVAWAESDSLRSAGEW